MEEIVTDDAPTSIGPYSQGIKHNNTVYVSGQGPVDPDSGEIVSEDVQEQTQKTLENVSAVLAAAGTSLDDVLKSTVFVTDMADYEDVNEVYGEMMRSPFPARSAVEVRELPIDIRVEIEVIASV